MENRFCIQCGGALPEGAKFCPACGHLVAEVPEKTATVDAPAQTGEFILSQWDEPVSRPEPAPVQAAPSARPSVQKDIKKKKKRPFIVRAFRFIFGLVITAIILVVLYWFYQGFTSA